MRGQGPGFAAVQCFSPPPWLLAFAVVLLCLCCVLPKVCCVFSDSQPPLPGYLWGFQGEGKRVVCEGMLTCVRMPVQ
jgi:hypothetical protein